MEGGWTGEGILSVDPELTPAYRLQADSPCIDAAGCEDTFPRDMDGETRWDDPAHSNQVSIADMGADEIR